MAGKVGRPSKLTPELQEHICREIRGGNFPEVAAKLAGVSRSTFYEWIKDNEVFADAISKADADAESQAIGLIRQAAADPKHWTAAAWYLERKHRDRWGKDANDLHDLEVETLKAKLKLLESGNNPDAPVINVHIPDLTKSRDDQGSGQ